MLSAQRVPERRIERRFCTDDLDGGSLCARRHRVAGDQPAAPDRNHEQVEVGNLFQHFERNRPLPGDHPFVVIGVDEGEAALPCDRLGPHLRLRNRFAVEHHLGAVGLCRLDLHERGRYRHHDRDRNAQPPGVVGDRLRMIAGRHRNDAAGALGWRERSELVEGAALLERIGDLEVLIFDEDLRAGQRRQFGRRQHRRTQDVARNDTPRRLDIRECDRHRAVSCPPLLSRAVPNGPGPLAANQVYSPFAGGFEREDSREPGHGRQRAETDWRFV